jgi:predicted xylose isomerase-like sugar epimerase
VLFRSTAVARFDATTGKLMQNSSVTISDAAVVAGAKTLAMSGTTSGELTLRPAATTVDHTLTLPASKGSTGTFLQISDGVAGTLAWAAAGNVTGAASSTDNAVARFDTTTGKLIQSSAVTISDNAEIAGAKTVALSGAASGALTLAPAATTNNHTLTVPGEKGAAGTFLQSLDGTGALTWATSGDGNVSGASSSTDNAVVRFDSTTGKLIQNSAVTISDAADVSGVKTLALSGATAGTFTLTPASTTVTYGWTLPDRQGSSGAYLTSDGNGNLDWGSPPGLGDVSGPSSSTASALARFDGTTGKLIKDSAVTVTDDGAISGVTTLGVAGIISGVAMPLAVGDAANKQYVDNAVSGLRWKDPVDAATTTNLASLSGLLTVDDVTLVEGNRVLVRAQTDGTENGV